MYFALYPERYIPTMDFEEIKHPLTRAVEEESADALSNLSKSEAIYAICEKLGVDLPEGHPDDHNGNVTDATVKNWLFAVYDVEAPEGDS